MIQTKSGKTYTGAKMELCGVCDEVFNNTRAADKHRVVVGKYTMVRHNGRYIRMNPDQDVIPKGAKVLSDSNEYRRCLTADEMRRIGMNQEKNGAWNSGGNWKGMQS